MSKTLYDLLADQEKVFCQPVEFNERYNVVLSLPLKSSNDILKIRERIKSQSNVINIEMNTVSSMKIFPENISLDAEGR